MIIVSTTDIGGTEIFATDAGCARTPRGCNAWQRLTNTPKPQLPLGGEHIDIRFLTPSPDGKQLAFSYRAVISAEEVSRLESFFKTVVSPERENEDIHVSAFQPWLSQQNWGIYVLDIDECLAIITGCSEDKFRQLTPAKGADIMPAWSPNGSTIAFISNRSSFLELYTMNSDGSGQIKISSDQAMAYLFPDWTPDGARLIFGVLSQARYAAPKLYDAKADGSDLRAMTDLLLEGSEGDENPHWSPDSELLVFSSTRGGASEIFAMRAGSTTPWRLTSNGGAKEPYWSPDGTRIIFLAPGQGDDEFMELWIMDRNGQNTYQLTQLGYIDFAVWAKK